MNRFHLLPLVAFLMWATGASWAQTSAPSAKAATKPRPAAERPSDLVTLSFNNAEISEVARAMAMITNRSVVVDPRVKGTVSLNTDKPVSKLSAYNQFLGALRLQGFAVVETAGLYKVVPEAEAKLQGGAVSDSLPRGPGNQIATQIFRLNHETANNLVPVLRPLISPNNTINVNPGNNSLVVTDYSDNLQRVGRIIAVLDVPNASDLDIIVLRHAIATDVVPLLNRLLESQASAPAAGQGQTDTGFRTVLLAEPRANAVIVRAANPARAALARSLVQRLDQPGSNAQPQGNIHVVYLRNADATKLAATLRAAMAAGDTRSGGAGAGSSGLISPPPATTGVGSSSTQASAQPSTGGQIQADVATNALIITAPEPQYRQLRAVIDLLDARRAQVFVESLIVEVNAEKAAEFGAQWQGLLGGKGDGVIGAAGTNFNTGGASNNIINLARGAGSVVPGVGLNFGLFNRTNGVYNLGFLARFLQSSGDANVLSTPNLLTLDNEEAKIVIGQNVPFVTGQYSNSNSGTGTVNPFQTIERRDVGLTLRVKPQINENGTVKLQIFQEVSNVDKSTAGNASGVTTNKRSIESSVLVEDGAIVVLGGLLQDEYAGNQDKIPGLGDVPFLGNLFKSEARSRKKSNLMVFLRPVIVRDAQASNTLSMDRYDMMRSLQEQSLPAASQNLPVNDVPQMPSAAPGAQPAGQSGRPLIMAPMLKSAPALSTPPAPR
jgi:general secretion pathway protein D